MSIQELADQGTDSPHENDSSHLSEVLEHVAHFLPSQGPIEVFVHHNTLHAFENQSFDDAVKAGWNRYGGEPYFLERVYRDFYSSGRITDHDIEAVLREDLGDARNDEINGLGTKAEIRFAMLRHAIHIGPDAELRWIVAESDALERFRRETTDINRTRCITASQKWLRDTQGTDQIQSEFLEPVQSHRSDPSRWSESEWESFAVHLLWRVCLNGVSKFPTSKHKTRFLRPRDLLLHSTGEDIDRNIHDVLIRFCAAFVDQGYASWLLPNRGQGFFESFTELFSKKPAGIDRWLRKLPREVQQLLQNETTPEQSILDSLNELGIEEADLEEFIAQTLLSIGGWTGMIWQLETGVDWVVHSIPKGSLMGMLAVQLLLEKHAILEVGEEYFGQRESISNILRAANNKLHESEPQTLERRAFMLFQVAQMLGWTPLELLKLNQEQWHDLSLELESFTGIERRRIFHEAYERKYRHATLDAFAVHSARRKQETQNSTSARPSFQIVTCIDDREESFRRHLEEVDPQCETFGAAGFFAVAIYYRGAAEGFYKPLCPGVIIPDHYIQEDVGYSFEGVHRDRAQMRRRLGMVQHTFQTRSRTFIGGMFAGIVGSLATFPLVISVLFPRMTSRIRQRFGSLIQPPPVTQLQLERSCDDPGPDNGHIGYKLTEMADVVVRLLQDIGLTQPTDFSRLTIICGHGSSSLNNPHESAYCCGACAGKRGGPNARAFAQMANDWRVRQLVNERGISIPEDTFFVGSYHNTCDDSVVFYDLDRLPTTHRPDFESARDSIEEARRRNAHERCRRFVSAPLDISTKEALRHVEGRAQDIAQARPEYNHATNALCIVGRRDWSRGLFLDRRAFLTSYDPACDDEEHSILFRILSAAIPVCAGINLEYYFSCVDYTVYGSGSKLPHNLVSLLGVMEGTSSDLRTGLHQQMVEIHEPIRLLFLIETTPEAMLSIMERNEAIDRLVRGSWVHLAVIDPETSQIQIFRDNRFQNYDVGDHNLQIVGSSLECYRQSRDHQPFFSIQEEGVVR